MCMFYKRKENIVSICRKINNNRWDSWADTEVGKHWRKSNICCFIFWMCDQNYNRKIYTSKRYIAGKKFAVLIHSCINKHWRIQ